MEVEVNDLFQKRGATKQRSTKFSAADEIARALTRLGYARQAAVEVPVLDYFSTELAKHELRDVLAAIDFLCRTPRRDFEPVFPDLPTLHAAAETEKRKRGGNCFVSCGSCSNGTILLNRRGKPWTYTADGAEKFAEDCDCLASWRKARFS